MDMLAADGARRWLEGLLGCAQPTRRQFVSLAMLLFDLDDGQLCDGLRLSFILLTISLRLLL